MSAWAATGMPNTSEEPSWQDVHAALIGGVKRVLSTVRLASTSCVTVASPMSGRKRFVSDKWHFSQLRRSPGKRNSGAVLPAWISWINSLKLTVEVVAVSPAGGVG